MLMLCVSPTAVTCISFGLLMLLNVVLVEYVFMSRLLITRMNRKCKIYILYPNHLISTPYQPLTFRLRIYFFCVNSDITVVVISQVDR